MCNKARVHALDGAESIGGTKLLFEDDGVRLLYDGDRPRRFGDVPDDAGQVLQVRDGEVLEL